MQEIQNILRQEPSKMYSREEILNLLAPKRQNYEIERLLTELEITSSFKEAKSDIYSTCRGGTVYYKWNNTTTSG
jgi:DNA-binding transcriptional regulator GbsR (MarR family)